MSLVPQSSPLPPRRPHWWSLPWSPQQTLWRALQSSQARNKLNLETAPSQFGQLPPLLVSASEWKSMEEILWTKKGSWETHCWKFFAWQMMFDVCLWSIYIRVQSVEGIFALVLFFASELLSFVAFYFSYISVFLYLQFCERICIFSDEARWTSALE